MNIKPLAHGMKRQWLKCNKCGRPAYYDFVPYSLSKPIMTMPCGHGLGVDHTTTITADEAMVLLSERMSARQYEKS